MNSFSPLHSPTNWYNYLHLAGEKTEVQRNPNANTGEATEFKSTNPVMGHSKESAELRATQTDTAIATLLCSDPQGHTWETIH